MVDFKREGNWGKRVQGNFDSQPQINVVPPVDANALKRRLARFGAYFRHGCEEAEEPEVTG